MNHKSFQRAINVMVASVLKPRSYQSLKLRTCNRRIWPLYVHLRVTHDTRDRDRNAKNALCPHARTYRCNGHEVAAARQHSVSASATDHSARLYATDPRLDVNWSTKTQAEGWPSRRPPAVARAACGKVLPVGRTRSHRKCGVRHFSLILSMRCIGVWSARKLSSIRCHNMEPLIPVRSSVSARLPRAACALVRAMFRVRTVRLHVLSWQQHSVRAGHPESSPCFCRG